MKSELRRFLEDEFASIAEPMCDMEARARDFWNHPEDPALAVWGAFPAVGKIPEHPSGSLVEEHLYSHLMRHIKPALEARRHGFDNVPIIYPPNKPYEGPDYRTHFLSGVMGAEAVFPEDLQEGEEEGLRCWVRPLVQGAAEIPSLEEVDVSKSPLLRAVLRAYEEMSEIVGGGIPFTHYSPVFPLDFAADIFGYLEFFELVAADADAASQLLDVCLRKWLEMMRLQERAMGGRWANANYEPGAALGDMILFNLSPRSVRRVVLPYNEKVSHAFGGIVVGVHPDPTLLADYVRLPGFQGCSAPADWPAEILLEALQGKGVLVVGCNWHFHSGEKKWAPVCRLWDEYRSFVAKFAGRLRILVTVGHQAESPQERRDGVLRDLEDLRRTWQDG